MLVELDREILDARVKESEGKLAQAQGALESARSEIRRIEVEKTDPEIAYSQRTWERTQKLYADGLASDAERDFARDRFEKAEYRVRLLESQLTGARAALASADGRLKEIQGKPSPQDR